MFLQPVQDTGPCKNFMERWYFNQDDGICEPFQYGGCAGNRNHFFTQHECEVHCARFVGKQKVCTKKINYFHNDFFQFFTISLQLQAHLTPRRHQRASNHPQVIQQ
jgi:hypothetical protein